MPSPETLDTKGFWGLAGVALSVGIRPCTGAILVLVFAYTLGAFWIGAVSALAMSIGTALTVSLLALLALGGKRIAFALSGAGSSRAARGLDWTLRIGGGLVLAAVGTLMFVASLEGPRFPL